LLRLVLQDGELDPTERDRILVTDQGGLNPVAVDISAIGRTQVHQPRAAGVQFDPRVITRDSLKRQFNVIGRMPANGRR
jgi:hypothetical protein